MTAFDVHRLQGTPAELHAMDLSFDAGPSLWVMEPTEPAIVMGSAQSAATVDRALAERSGLAVARRRTGGGAVLVRPGEQVWVDVTIPTTDPNWCADIIASSEWMGSALVAALSAVGCGGAVAHRGRLVGSRWSRVCCFAALGPGEVTIEGRKVAGIAQRRVRHGVRFQCSVVLVDRVAEIADYLLLEQGERVELRALLAAETSALTVNSGTFVRALRRVLTA